MIRVLTMASALALAGCATVVSAPQATRAAPASVSSGGGLSPQDVSAGFATAVVDGCVAAAEAGKTLEQLGSAEIVRDDSRPATFKRAGQTSWAPRRGQGIVAIDEGTAACDVSAYGPPVKATFDAIVGALQGKGYQPQTLPPAGARSFEHMLSKTVDGRKIVVTLVGNEPGAPGTMSRFSTLTAFVKAGAP